MANNAMTHRERMVQASGSIEALARCNRIYVERTHKTAADVTHHLQCLSDLVEWASRLQAAAYDVYAIK